MIKYYRLGGADGHTPVPADDAQITFDNLLSGGCADPAKMAEVAAATIPQTLRRTELADDYTISTIFLPTVFLPIVSSIDDQPHCFETGVIRPGGKVKDIFRHATWDEAMAFHDALVTDFKTTMARARSDRDDAVEKFVELFRALREGK